MAFIKRILTSVYLNLRYLKAGEIMEKIVDSGKYLYWRQVSLDYPSWLQRFGPKHPKKNNRKNRNPQQDITFHYLIFVDCGTVQTFEKTIKSIRNQHSADSSLTLIGSEDRCKELLPLLSFDLKDRTDTVSRLSSWKDLSERKTKSTANYFITISAQDQLNPWAVDIFTERLQNTSGIKFLYCDSDCIDNNGHHHSPNFKPAWNYELFLHSDYVGTVAVIHHSVLPSLPLRTDGSPIFDLYLGSLENLKSAEISHIPQVLVHQQGSWNQSSLAVADALTKHFQRKDIAATVILQRDSSLRISYPLPPEAKASIIIPTRNRCDLLKTCIDSIIKKTSFKNYEIIVVDNGSDESTTQDYLTKLKDTGVAKVLRDDRPFNYSALNNMAARQCDGNFLCFVNNDIEVISPDWLTDLIANANRASVGAVGARLWYPDNHLQHAGIILGLNGVAGHGHSRLAQPDTGYQRRAHLPQFYSAVTGACLCVQRRKFELVNGFNENQLSVGFNDVDLCLKLKMENLENLWLPQVELYHHESVSRGKDLGFSKHSRSFLEILHMKRTYRELIKSDPHYNPNLTLRGKAFELAIPPRR